MNITAGQQGYVQNAYAALAKESTDDENDNVQTVITQMVALATQSEMTVASTVATTLVVMSAINQLAANQQAMLQQIAAFANAARAPPVAVQYPTQFNIPPISNFQGGGNRGGRCGGRGHGNRGGRQGLQGGDKEEEGTHAPHLQTTPHVKEVAASPLLPRNQCQDCHFLAQGLRMLPLQHHKTVCQHERMLLMWL